MIYSDYSIDQIASPMYEQVAQKLLSLSENEETKKKISGILYEGGFDNFFVNGSYNMEKEVLFKNNPSIEASKRLNMAYLLLTNPEMVETMQQTGASFFHGTNANALPGILKYGINSVDKSTENNIEVTTGEEYSRIQGKRSFVSITDCLDEALNYTKINSNIKDQLLNFGVMIGISLKDMKNINTTTIDSDIPEIGVVDNLPLDNIKFLAVPNDKEDFVKKLVGQKDIKIVGMNLDDKFYNLDFKEKLNSLDFSLENNISTDSSKTFTKQEVQEEVKKGRFSKIKETFINLKNKFLNRGEKNIDIGERS